MLATTARADLVEPVLPPPPADAIIAAGVAAVDVEDGDPIAPARGIALGMALGLLGIAAVVLLARWLG